MIACGWIEVLDGFDGNNCTSPDVLGLVNLSEGALSEFYFQSVVFHFHKRAQLFIGQDEISN